MTGNPLSDNKDGYADHRIENAFERVEDMEKGKIDGAVKVECQMSYRRRHRLGYSPYI